MARAFDPEAWREKARARAKRALASGGKDALVKGRLNDDLHAIEGLKKVVDWCSERDLNIRFTNDAYAGIDGTLIYVNVASRPVTQLCLLLHECGHHLIGACGDKNVVFDETERVDDGEEKTHSDIVNTIGEEFEAWRRGINLARRLKIKLNVKEFSKLKTKLLFTYFKWASKNG